MQENKTQALGPGEKLKNFWYYYKGHLLVGGVILFILLFALVSGLSRHDPDANLLYLGTKTLSDTQRQEIHQALQQVIGKDLNQDQSIHTDLVSLSLRIAGKNEWGEIVYDSSFYEAYQQELYGGDTVIFLVESEDLYEQMLVDGLLVPLANIFGETPEQAHDAFSFRLGDLPLGKQKAFQVFSPDAYLCVRHVRVVNGQSTQGDQKKQQTNQEAFRAMAEYRADSPEE